VNKHKQSTIPEPVKKITSQAIKNCHKKTKDAVLEEYPQPQRQVKDKKSWPWPKKSPTLASMITGLDLKNARLEPITT